MQDFILAPEVIQDYLKERHEYNLERSISYLIESNMIKISNIIALITSLSRDMTLGSILDEALKQYPYECPCCNGTGKVEKAYYPDPRSDWPSYHMVECDVCNGIGFTKKKIVPNMVQDGWKTEE